MQCEQCGAENSGRRQFCGVCGAALSVPCPGCGFGNEPGAQFCGGCGTPLSGRGRQQSEHRGDAATERRRVAVLFVDLSGYTSLTAELGAEDTRALLDRFFATVDSLVERHGGTIVQHVGDCAMALFGAPRWRCWTPCPSSRRPSIARFRSIWV